MATRNSRTMFNDHAVEKGAFLWVEFDTDLWMWVMITALNGPHSVEATILEPGRDRYKQGRHMVIHLKYAREYRSKDNPPPLWSIPRAA